MAFRRFSAAARSGGMCFSLCSTIRLLAVVVVAMGGGGGGPLVVAAARIDPAVLPVWRFGEDCLEGACKSLFALLRCGGGNAGTARALSAARWERRSGFDFWGERPGPWPWPGPGVRWAPRFAADWKRRRPRFRRGEKGGLEAGMGGGRWGNVERVGEAEGGWAGSAIRWRVERGEW